MGAGGCNYHAARGIDDAVGQGICGESTEYDAVHRANPGTGEHGYGQFGNHRHIYRHPIALYHTSRFEHVCEFADARMQFAVGDVAVLRRVVTFPDDGILITSGIEMSVEAVVDDVGFAAFEPFYEDRTVVHIVIV